MRNNWKINITYAISLFIYYVYCFANITTFYCREWRTDACLNINSYENLYMNVHRIGLATLMLLIPIILLIFAIKYRLKMHIKIMICLMLFNFFFAGKILYKIWHIIYWFN